jgi:hypothetical protein
VADRRLHRRQSATCPARSTLMGDACRPEGSTVQLLPQSADQSGLWW